MAILRAPSNFLVQQANRQVLISFDNLAGATSYIIRRSTDNVTFTTLATITANSYLDTTVTISTQYFYQVAAVDSTSTTGLYTNALSVIPTPTGEMSLAEIRYQARLRADRVNSNFFTTPELNSYINSSLFELYDILVTAYEDYFMAPPAIFVTDGITQFQNLPDGITPFLVAPNSTTTFVPQPIDKLLGVDLGVASSTTGFVTLSKFQFIERNKYVFPNSQSALYGNYNVQYRMMGNQLEMIPLPAAGQYIRLWYIPRMPELLLDTDTTNFSLSRWVEYVIVDVAIKMLQKEEADVSVLIAQKMLLKQRIESAAQNRDAGQPDTIADTRLNTNWGSNGTYGGGWGSNMGGIG